MKAADDSSKEPLLLNPAPIFDHEIVQEHAAPELSVQYKLGGGVKQSFSMQMQKIFVPNEEDNSKGGNLPPY